jgi:ABC-type branched-subunit amino acid transport system permease subunit
MTNILRWWWDILLAFSLLALLRVFSAPALRDRDHYFSIYTMGCNFLLGRVGFISFGQPAYLAVGAYATAFYLYYFGQNPYLGILLGLLGGIIVAVIVGPFFVRLRSDYFALVNLALAVAHNPPVVILDEPTGGGHCRGDPEVNGLYRNLTPGIQPDFPDW